MNVTKYGNENRKLHNEGYQQRVSTESKEYAEVLIHTKITENNHIITEIQDTELLEKILHKDNLDRVIQQAITQVLTPIYEKQFSDNSYGFRPNRSAHNALKKCRENVNEGYVYVVNMDLEKFFDTVVIKLTQYIRGWVNYFSLADMKALLQRTDEWLRRKIRAIYWKQLKKIKTRYKMIRKYNLPEWKVHELANCRKGIWRSAIMLNSVLTNKEIANLGYISMTAYYLKICEI